MARFSSGHHRNQFKMKNHEIWQATVLQILVEGAFVNRTVDNVIF